MSNEYLLDEIEEERDIAKQAARVLHETFIAKASNGPVLYVENDTVMRKAPNEEPVVIKRLSGRVPELSQRVRSLGTIKIKKRRLMTQLNNLSVTEIHISK